MCVPRSSDSNPRPPVKLSPPIETVIADNVKSIKVLIFKKVKVLDKNTVTSSVHLIIRFNSKSGYN